MSASTLRDLNVLPTSELDKIKGLSVNGTVTKPIVNGNSCVDKEQNSPSLSASQPEQPAATTNGSECAGVDIEYIESENLPDLSDVDSALSTLVSRLDSKDWVTVCEALNNVRQVAKYHKEGLLEQLVVVVPLVVKSVKNPRSALCKTALMTCADIFKVYNDLLIDSLDLLLVQLFLKSSQDKRFVCEAAEAALIAMTSSISAAALLPKLEPYLKNKHPRIRAKASMCFSKSVSRLEIDGIKEYGIDKLIQVAATQLSDRLPESREAARHLALELQVFYEKSQNSTSETSEAPDAESWEAFCQSKLSPLDAQAILRVTSTPKEGPTVGC